jgi:hypothetical protein
MSTFRFAALLLGMAALAACGGGDHGDHGEPAITVVALAGGAAEVTYPLDRYQAMGDQRTAIDTAQAVLVQRCLAEGGLDLPLGKAADEPNRPIWYGVTTESEARGAGYNAVGRPVADLPFVQRVAMDAKPLFDGCLAEANRTITEGSPPLADTYLVTTLEKRALKQSQKDSRVQAVIGEWRDCMAAEGHDFTDPWAPYDHWSQERAKQDVTPEQKQDPRSGLTAPEVAMALTDVRCKDSTRLLDTWVAATIAYQHQLADEHADQLALHQQAVTATVSNADRVLAEA